MAIPFNTNTRIPSVQGGQQIIPTPTVPTPQNNIYIFGNRRNPTSTETDGLPILTPAAGFPRYNYYECNQLPTEFLNSPIAMLSYFSSCGFTVEYGYSDTITLVDASAVDITTLAAEEQVIVYYASSADLIAPMVGSVVTGTFDDTTATVTGTLVSAEVGTFTVGSDVYDSRLILQSTDFADVDAGDTIEVSFVNADILVPDANLTEPFIMNLYQAIQASLIPLNVNSTVATPNVFFGILPNSSQSGLFGPTSSAVTLSVPSDADATTLVFDIPSNNVSLIPLKAWGNSTITQATSNATGTIKSAQINGNILIVTLENVTGTFNTTNVCTLDLDSGVTIFDSQKSVFANRKISLAHLALPYAITSSTGITTTYKAAFDYIAALNLPQTSQDGQAVAQIVFGNLTAPLQTASSGSLPTNVNNYQYEPVWYPYQPVTGELPLSAGQLTAAYAMVVGSNVTPLNPQAGVVINGLPAATDATKHVSVAIGGVADAVMKLGWNVIAVNSNNQAYVINPITGQTTLPGLPTPDNEFFAEYVWQTVDYLRKGVNNICLNIGLGQVRQSGAVLANLKQQILSFMLTMQTDGMLKNVLANQSLITITQNPVNPLGVDVKIPTQIIPGLLNIYYTIDIYSSTVTLQTAA